MSVQSKELHWVRRYIGRRRDAVDEAKDIFNVLLIRFGMRFTLRDSYLTT